MKRVARFALCGAVGFGIGGLFSGLAMLLALFAFPRFGETWLLVIVFVILGFGFAAKGALGGTALGLALRRGRRRVASLALFGGIGFLVAGFLATFVPTFLPVFGGRGMFQPSFSMVLLDGAVGGAVLGLALRDKRKIMGLALAGALGFWIGSIIVNYLQHWLVLGWLLLVIKFSLQGIVGGALLGVALGYLEKE